MSKETERNQKVAVLILGILALASSMWLLFTTKEWVIIPAFLTIISGVGIGITVKKITFRGVEHVKRI